MKTTKKLFSTAFAFTHFFCHFTHGAAAAAGESDQSDNNEELCREAKIALILEKKELINKQCFEKVASFMGARQAFDRATMMALNGKNYEVLEDKLNAENINSPLFFSPFY